MAKRKCPLVLIEWEDSRQPSPHWRMLHDMEEPDISRCASVGWLVRDTKEMKALAQNVGDRDYKHGQVGGVMAIPTRCVIKITKLKEPS